MKKPSAMRSRLTQSDIILGPCLVLLASCTTITSFGSSDGTEGESESESESSGGILPSGSDQGSGAPTGNGSSSSGMDASSSDGSGSDETEGNSFIKDDDWPGCRDPLPDGVLAFTRDCSVLYQDCCPGEACRAWANDGGSIWNSTRCWPVDPDAGQAGDPCIAEGSAVSGVDSCDIGLMCWEVDSNTLQGTCIEYCSGSQARPVCSSADDVCAIRNDGALALCLPSCDLVLNDCDADEVCVAAEGDSFGCFDERYTRCPAGTAEIDPLHAVGCGRDEPCCSPYCDLTEEAPCGQDLECVPLLPEPHAAYPDLGVCVSALKPV